MNNDTTLLAGRLDRDAHRFLADKREDHSSQPLTWIVADLEFKFDRDRFDAFKALHGNDDKRGIRWPFHQLAAISWIALRFAPGADVPEVDAPVVMSAQRSSQEDMLGEFFDTLATAGPSRLVTWGGEARDYAVLRHLASRYGLVVPEHLRSSSPNAGERLDLCREVTALADKVHLQEFAGGSGVPCKPSDPEQVGRMAENGKWSAVEDHCLADVATTTMLLLRHLAANALAVCHREKSAVAVSEAIGAAFPNSPFWKRDLKPWARDKLRAAGLKGKVYRVDEAA